MADKKKSAGKLLEEKLYGKKENCGEKMTAEEEKACDEFCEGYKAFLDSAKTEREANAFAIDLAKKSGFTEYDEKKKYKAGDKVYRNNRGKAVLLAVFGKESIENGVSITAAHIDSPRLDLKQNPLYEEADLAYFETHYYGGIKKYHWPAMPLALHGVIVRRDGSKVTVCIGEDESDPVFVVTDLLPHLAAQQYKRPSNELIKGEELNILIGARAFRDDDVSKKVKLNIMNILFEKYNIVESDFFSAELEAVPAYKAKDVGFDRSMIGSYGQDDRVCAYTALMAMIDSKGVPNKTAVTCLTDKEETGSDGNTGLKSCYLRYFINDLADAENVPLRKVLSNSRCLSADVNTAFDPTFPDVLEKHNCAYINCGIAMMKYSGSRGKSGTSDANAEFVWEIRKLLDDNKIFWQMGELGKVDMGGGGTIAPYVANLDVDTIDLGVPVLSMHSPFEVTAKADVYAGYRAYKAFIER